MAIKRYIDFYIRFFSAFDTASHKSVLKNMSRLILICSFFISDLDEAENYVLNRRAKNFFS